MSKYGSASASFLVDGYNLLANKVKGLRYKVAAVTEETTGMGDAWAEHTPTGMARVEVGQEGGYFDTAANRSHDALSGSVPGSPSAAVRVMWLGFAGQVIGATFVGLQGVFTLAYEVLGELGDLTKAHAEYTVTGRMDSGVILHPLSAETSAGNTEGSSVDNAASSSAGGAAHLQVTALTLGGYTSATVKIRDSADNVTYADLVAFAAVDAAPSAQRVVVAGTVGRYLAQSVAFDGAGSNPSITYAAGFARY